MTGHEKRSVIFGKQAVARGRIWEEAELKKSDSEGNLKAGKIRKNQFLR
jgi:hypothetical protein